MLANLHGGLSEYLKLLGYRRFHYLWWPKSSPALAVLLHGLGECANTFGPFARSLRTAAEVIAVDLRGHGGTPWDPDRQYHFEDYLDDLRIQMEHWQRSITLVGAGLGAALALEVARRRPQQVDGVALLGPRPEGAADNYMAELLASDRGKSEWQDAALSPQALRDMLTWARPGGLRVPKCDPRSINPAGCPQHELEAITQVPTMVVAADESQIDGWTPATTTRTATIRAAGRWPHIGNPAAAAQAVGSFIARLRPDAQPRTPPERA